MRQKNVRQSQNRAQPAVSKKPATPSSSKPLEKLTIIDTSIKNDRSVELRGNVDLTANTAMQIQRALLLQAIAKNGESSSLKLYLGYAESSKYRLQDQAALADTMLMVNLPVDVIVRSAIGPDVLKAFLSATGKRFMLAGARIQLGVVTHNAPYAKNKMSQVRRQLFNDYQTDLQTQLMLKTGITDRTKVYKDLLSAKGYNALESLYYGKYGLVEGVLMEHDQVITREDLEAYYQQHQMDEDAILTFNKHYINVYKLPTRPLSAFSPESIPSGTTSFYISLKKSASAPKKQDGNTEEAPAPEEPKLPVFYLDEKKQDPLPMMIRAKQDKPNKRMMVDNVGAYANGILDDDVIFLNDGFQNETAEQILDALIALDHKKTQQKSKSHIKIIENSPGGSVWSGQELRSTIRSLKTPVDIIVQGMGASCGSWLLCSATGHRYATPHSRIMFHEAANEVRSQTPHDHFNEILDSLDQATLDYIAIVAEASDRPFEEVLRDFDNDVWLNPIEALFYGKRGLIDAILVDYNQVITRQDVEAFLAKALGSRQRMNRYVEQKILEKRDPRLGMTWKPEEHNDTDTFDNPITTIAAIAGSAAKKLSEVRRFKGSVLYAERRTIDFFNVVLDDDKR